MIYLPSGGVGGEAQAQAQAQAQAMMLSHSLFLPASKFPFKCFALAPPPSPSPSPSPSLHNHKRVSHSHSQSAIQRISDKLRQLGYVQPPPPPPTKASPAGEIFIPTPSRVPPFRLASTLHAPPLPASPPLPTRFGQPRKKDKIEKNRDIRAPKELLPSLAELTLPPDELRRLRTLGIKLTQKLKLGKPGVTEGVVNGIHERWRRSEVVKIKCDDLCRLDMKRTHQILEVFLDTNT